MADFTALKTAIQNAIKQNGNEEITGNILQDVLLAIVSTLGDGSINDLITALGSEATTRSQADGTLQQNIDAEAQARQLADSTLQGGINTAMQAINAINNAIANGCVYAGIATPSSTPASGKVFYLALTAGTYTNYGGLEVPQGINILKNNGSTWLLDSFLGIDDAPTPSSNNLVKSGGIFNGIMTNGSAFDLTAYNNGTTYADLNAAITALNALPAAYKKGGMSMKYVQSSDNKYVQYRLMANTFSTTVSDWQGVDDEPTAGSENIVESNGVFNKLRVKELEIGGSVDIPVSEFVTGNAINTSGTLTPDDGRMITSFVEVIEGTIVTWNELQTNGQQLSVACYDASKNLISGSSTSQGSGQLTVDNTIKYIRFNARTNQIPSVNLLNQDSTNNRLILIDDETIIKEGTAVSSGDYLAYYLTENDIKRGKIQIQFSSSLNKVGVLYVYNKDYTKTYADGVGIEQNLPAGTYTFTLSPNADYLRLASDFGDTLTYKISYNGKLSEIKNELSQVDKKSNTVQNKNIIKEGIATYSDDYVEHYLNDFEKKLKRIFVKFSRAVVTSNPVTVYIYNSDGTKTLAENWNTQYLNDGVYGFILKENAQYIRLAGNNGEDINYSIYYEGEIYDLTRSMAKCFRINTVHLNKSYTGAVDADELFNGIEQGDIIKLSIKGTVSNLTAYLDNQYHNQSEVVRFGRNNHISKAGDYYCIATYKNLIDLRLYSAATDNNFSVELSVIGKLDEHSLSDSIKTMSRCIQINNGFTQTSAHECSIAFDKQFGYICVVYIGYDWTITGTPSYGESSNNFYLSYFPLWNPQNKKTMVVPIGNRYDPNIISLGNGVFRIIANNVFRDGGGVPTDRTIQRIDFDIKTETLTEWVDVLMTLSGDDVVCSYTNYAAYLDSVNVSHTDTRTGDEQFYQKWIGMQTAMHQEDNVIYSAINSYLNPSILIQSTDNFETVVPYAVLNKPEIKFEMDYYKNNNKLYAIYRCSDGIKYITSTDNGVTWSTASLFPCSSQSRPNIVKYKGLPLFIIPSYYEISTLYPNIDNNLDTNAIDFYYGEEVNMTDLVLAKQLISKYGFDYPKAFVLLDDIYMAFGEGRMAFGLWNNTICSAKEMISWLYIGEMI